MRARRRAAAAALLAGLALAGLGAVSLHAAVTQRVVTDPHSGLAIFGFDPVAYFTEGAPAQGEPGFEYRSGGATWRFRNEGNRAAFAASPEVYTPRFGGYDPLGVARGVATPGHPELWVRRNDRLYLFHKPETRTAFEADPQGAVAAAEGRWPQVVQDLGE